MQYRTATRLTDIRLTTSRTKYLYCDTETVLPAGSKVAWGRAFNVYSGIDEEAVFLSTKEDEALLKVLLARHDFVISLKSSEYAAYQATLRLVLNDKFEGFRESAFGGNTIGNFILRACVYNKSNPVSRHSWQKSLAEQIESASRSFGHLEDQVLYLTKVPEDIAYILWTQFTDKGAIYYYECDDNDSLTKINLVEALASTCTNFESTVEHGCITCEDRSGCLNNLSGGQLSTDPYRETISLRHAKSLLTREGLNYVPPSVVQRGSSMGAEGKLDFAGVNIASGDTSEKYKHHKLKYVKLKDSAKFYKEQCVSCVKVDICGTRGYAHSSWENGYYRHSINQDYCSGSKEVVVTPDNLETYIRTIFELILYNAGFNQNRFEAIAEIPNTAAAKVTAWVFEGSHLDKYASACIRHLEECTDKYYPASVIPVEIEQALKMLGLDSGFSNPREWWSHGMSGREWVESKTQYFEDFFPGIPSYSKSKWVVMTQPSRSDKLSSPRGRPPGYGWAVAESIDTTLYANMYGLKVKGYKPLKRFATINSRINLVLSAIKLYVSPSSKMWFGPFAGKTEHGPTALLANYYKAELPADRFRYYWGYKNLKNLTDMGHTEIVLEILTDIADTPAKYNLRSLELLSSLGELVDK